MSRSKGWKWQILILAVLLLLQGSLAIAGTKTRFSYCPNDRGSMDVMEVEAVFVSPQSVNISIYGSVNQPFGNINTDENTQATAFTKVSILGNQIFNQREGLCNLTQGCPASPGNVTFHKLLQFNASLHSHGVPLGEAVIQFRALHERKTVLTCVEIPLAFQNPTLSTALIYIPIGLTIFIALALLLPYFVQTVGLGDLFVYTSNYAMHPRLLKTKTPGLADIWAYHLFVVAIAQINIEGMPQFYRMFAVNFAWSGLYLGMEWVTRVVERTQGLSGGPSPLDTGSFQRRQSAPPPPSTVAPSSVANAADSNLSSFARLAGIDPHGLFITVLIWFSIVLAGMLLVHVVIIGLNFLLGWWRPARYGGGSSKLLNFTLGNILRLLLLFYLPLLTVCFEQLMAVSIWQLDLAAALLLIFPLFSLFAYIAFLVLRARPPSLLFDDMNLLLRFGPLYNTLTDETNAFFIVGLVKTLLWGALLGVVSNGTVQLSILVTAEVAYLGGLIYRRPYADAKINRFQMLVAGWRIIVLLLMFGVLSSNDVATRGWIAYVQILMHMIAYFTFFAMTLWNIIRLVVRFEVVESSFWHARLRQRRAATRSMPTTLTSIQNGRTASLKGSLDFSSGEMAGYRLSNSARPSVTSTLVGSGPAEGVMVIGGPQGRSSPLSHSALGGGAERDPEETWSGDDQRQTFYRQSYKSRRRYGSRTFSQPVMLGELSRSNTEENLTQSADGGAEPSQRKAFRPKERVKHLSVDIDLHTSLLGTTERHSPSPLSAPLNGSPRYSAKAYLTNTSTTPIEYSPVATTLSQQSLASVASLHNGGAILIPAIGAAEGDPYGSSMAVREWARESSGSVGRYPSPTRASERHSPGGQSPSYNEAYSDMSSGAREGTQEAARFDPDRPEAGGHFEVRSIGAGSIQPGKLVVVNSAPESDEPTPDPHRPWREENDLAAGRDASNDQFVSFVSPPHRGPSPASTGIRRSGPTKLSSRSGRSALTTESEAISFVTAPSHMSDEE
ncbi:uncharacterized protein VTP21DRAFT_10745 [Calcarisporiella thermophila]|uniref:uncharacterized protein n=1 Tax=Calcarisporiella thermophila TaxID=911321 RepID=UPI0037444481